MPNGSCPRWWWLLMVVVCCGTVLVVGVCVVCCVVMVICVALRYVSDTIIPLCPLQRRKTYLRQKVRLRWQIRSHTGARGPRGRAECSLALGLCGGVRCDVEAKVRANAPCDVQLLLMFPISNKTKITHKDMQNTKYTHLYTMLSSSCR